jgi:GH24 family phage-related lysozyme (muramidase)
MGTWIKETERAFYLMEGGHYVSKISKYPSKNNPAEQVVNIAAMKSWFDRTDSPGGMTVSKGGPEPMPKTAVLPKAATKADIQAQAASGAPKRTNQNGVLLIKSFEGLRLEAYRDAVGIWTIGYGTTRGVQPGMVISENDAERFLVEDLTRFEQSIYEGVKVPINDNQFSALVSFTYNVGSGALLSSTLLKLLNQREDLRRVADEFPRWNKAGGQVLDGLTRRRHAERSLFLGEDFHKFL